MIVAAVICGPLGLGDEVLEHDLGQLEIDRLAVQAGEGRHPDQRALQLPDVGGDPAGDVLQYLGRRVQALLDGLAAQDRDAGLQLGRLDVGQQPPLEPAAQPVLQRDQPLGGTVAGDDDLLAGVVQGVEGVEELLLRAFLVLQELDVVDQQHVDVAVAAAEAVLLAVPDHVDEVVGELLRADVPDLQAGVQGLRVMPDRVQQVGLAQPGVTVDEQRVVRLGRRLGDRDRGRVREPVARADDERLERVLGVQPGAAEPGGRLDPARPSGTALILAGVLAGVCASRRRAPGARAAPRAAGRGRPRPPEVRPVPAAPPRAGPLPAGAALAAPAFPGRGPGPARIRASRPAAPGRR